MCSISCSGCSVYRDNFFSDFIVDLLETLLIKFQGFQVLTRRQLILNIVRGKLHIDFRTQCVIMTQITWPPQPLLYAWFPDFWQNLQFLKNVSNVLDSKKGRLHLWRTLNFHIIVGSLFFCSVLNSRRKYWRNYLLWTAHWCGECSTPVHRIQVLISYQQFL